MHPPLLLPRLLRWTFLAGLGAALAVRAEDWPQWLGPQGGWNDQGELILARLNPKGYEEISRAKLLETTESARGREVVWSHPAFANRSIYVRNGRELICVSLAAETKG